MIGIGWLRPLNTSTSNPSTSTLHSLGRPNWAISASSVVSSTVREFLFSNGQSVLRLAVEAVPSQWSVAVPGAAPIALSAIVTSALLPKCHLHTGVQNGLGSKATTDRKSVG